MDKWKLSNNWPTWWRLNKWLFPILAEGFERIIGDRLLAPKNFDCFRDLNSSLITTSLSQFLSLYRLSFANQLQLHEDIFIAVNASLNLIQMKVIVDSLYSIKKQINIDWFQHCKCSLDYDCMKNKMDNSLLLYSIYHKILFEPSYHSWVTAKALNSHFDEAQYKKYSTTFFQHCRTTDFRKQDYLEVLKGNESRYHGNQCKQQMPPQLLYPDLCWNGELWFYD